jgi:hypothetical protein
MSAEAREDHAVLGALDALRDSSPDDLPNRHKLIDALTKLPATSPLARDARDTCAEAYRLVVEGKEAIMKVKGDMVRLEAAPKNAMADLATAQDKIEKSQPAMRACQKAAVELSVKRRK